MDFTLVDIAEAKSIPEPRTLTAEETAAIIARAKEQIDPVELEAEFKDLLKQYQRGELVDAEELLHEIEAGKAPRKPL